MFVGDVPILRRQKASLMGSPLVHAKTFRRIAGVSAASGDATCLQDQPSAVQQDDEDWSFQAAAAVVAVVAAADGSRLIDY